MSNAFDRFDGAPDAASLVVAEAKRQGVDPELALRVAHRESSMNPLARSPKGAVGVMQLMPGTAADLGVDPHDPEQNIRGGVTYLKRQIDHFGDPTLAAAAYNAGPGAVEKAGGVPNFPETKAYVAATAPQGGNPFDQFDGTPAPAQPPAQPASPPVLSSHNGGVTIGIEPKAKPTLEQDVGSGFLSPFRALANDVQSRAAELSTRKAPTSLGDLGHQLVSDLTSTPRLVGEALGLSSAPVQAVVRPVARALPDPYSTPQLSVKGGKVSIIPSRRLAGDEAQASKENMINTALAGAKPVGPLPARPLPATLDELKAAKTAAYAKVDASGYRFPNSDVQAIADDVGTQIRDMGGPKASKLLAPSDAMHARLDALAKQKGGVPLTQLEKLRSDVYDVLVKPGGADAKIGGELRAQIDNLITASGNPEVAQARAANTSYMKVKDVTARADSADLRAASTYAGGNKANATRQNLRPLIDPKSPQRMRNLTPDETKALNAVVRGTPAANLARVTGKLLDPRGLLGAAFQGALGIPTGGHSLLAAVPGMAASEASNALTMKSLQDLIDLMSMGGKRPGPQIPPMAAPGSVSLLSPRGLIGAGVVAAPVARIPSGEGRTKTTHSQGSRAR